MGSLSRQVDKDCLCFQDFMQKHYSKGATDGNIDQEEDEYADVANVFFELANAKQISYRISEGDDDGDHDDPNATTIFVQQDVGACEKHTGGIVWETAYLLLNYLRQKKLPCKRFLEVGAGCGLVGLGVHRAKLSKYVVLTECAEVMPNLLSNIARNSRNKTNKVEKHSKRPSKKEKLSACQLDWTRYKHDCEAASNGLKPHSMDVIVGTDVVFSTKLVEPLLETLRYMSHEQTQILLCLQERCKDSHALLLAKAGQYQLEVQDISKEVAQVETCGWSTDLECCMLKLTVIVHHPSSLKVTKKRKTRS